MYISRCRLDMTRKKTQLALESPGKLHGAVERAFSSRQNRTLWRIDRLKSGTYILIVSADVPDLESIAEQYGYRTDIGECKDYDAHLARMKEQTIWRFRLAANPTYSQGHKGERGNIRAHVSERYQMNWLSKMAETHGFALLPDTGMVMSSAWKSFYKQDSSGRVRFREVVFEGALQVKDEILFRQALINGIGREKAYGMGMLNLAKA